MVDRSEKLRRFYARYVARQACVQDPRIEQAFAAVPREPFAGPAPWHIVFTAPWARGKAVRGYVETPDDDPAFLYQDVLVALDAARGINIGQPSLHARCLDAVSIQEGETVLHIGAGSGYYTTILAHLVGHKGAVHAFEIDAGLAVRAGRNVASVPWVDVHARSGLGTDLPKADVVYVNAALTQPSWFWLDALRAGGRLLFPLQAPGGWGAMLLVRRPASGGMVWPASFVSRASFIACEAPRDDDTARRLTAAFANNDGSTVQSLHLDAKADLTCWFKGDGWWLSTEPAPSEG